MCHFVTEDEQFRTINKFVAEILENRPLDGFRRLYLSMLKLLNLDPKRRFPESQEHLAGLSQTFAPVDTDLAYKGWLSSTRPAMLYLREPAAVEELSVAPLLCSHICAKEALSPAFIVRYSLRQGQDQYFLASEARRSILGQILMAKPNLMIYLYHTFGTSLEEFLDDHQKDEEAREFALLRTVLSCPEASGLTVIIGPFNESTVGGSVLLSDICEAMLGADTSIRAIVYGAVDISKFTNLPERLLENLHQVNLEDYAVKEGRPHRKILIGRALDKIIKKEPCLANFRQEVEELIPDFEDKPMEDLLFGLKCIQASHPRSTPSAFRREIAECLGRSPKVTFDRVIGRLDHSHTEWAAKLLMWIVFSPQLLRVEQLATALSLVEDDGLVDSSEDELARDLEADITQYLGSLVVVEDKWVTVAHPAMIQLAKEFVQTVFGPDDANFNPHRVIAKMCFKFLSSFRLRSFWQSLSDSDQYRYQHNGGRWPERFWKQYGLTLYAVECWPDHFRKIENPTDADVEMVTSQLNDFYWLVYYLYMYRQLDLYTFPPKPRFSEDTAFGLARDLGLDILIKVLPKPPAAEIGRSLVSAAVLGHIKILEYLIETHRQETAPFLTDAIAALSRHTPNSTAIFQRLFDELESVDYGEHLEGLLEPVSRLGRSDLLKKILQSSRDLVQLRDQIQLALRAAIYTRNAEIVNLILSLDLYRPGNEHPCTFSGYEIIHADQNVLSALVTRPPRVHFGQDRSLLRLAVLSGSEAVLRQLIKIGIVNLNTKDAEGRTPIHYAALYGHSTMVDILISAKAEIDLEDNNGETPLFFAVRSQQPEIIGTLLVAKADPKKRNKREETLVRIATQTKSVHIVKVLIEKDAILGHVKKERLDSLLLAVQLGSVEIMSCIADEQSSSTEKYAEYKLSPLILAASKGYTELCKSLLGSGSSIDEQDEEGLTSLHYAARAGSVETVDLLLRNGAQVQRITDRKRTALHYAAEEGNMFTAQSLLRAGDTATLRDEVDETPFECAVSRRNFYTAAAILGHKSVKVPTGSSALDQLLLIAIEHGILEIVELAIQKGADVNTTYETGSSTLLKALHQHDAPIAKAILKHGFVLKLDPELSWTMQELAIETGDDPELLELLRLAGADMHHIAPQGSLLHFATTYNRLELVRYLLSHDADVNARDSMGATPLYLAINKEEIAKELLAKNSDARAQGGRWGTILNAAVCRVWRDANHRPDIFDMLLGHGAQGSDPDAQGITPVHIAAFVGDIDLLQFFMEKNASALRLKDRQDRLPLHYAAAHSRLDIVEFILNSSADEGNPMVGAEDIDGWTPLHWACRGAGYERSRVVQFLLRQGAEPGPLKFLGWRPEHIAIFHGGGVKKTIAMLLLEEGTNDPVNGDEESEMPPDFQAGSEVDQAAVPPEDRWKTADNDRDDAEDLGPAFAGKFPLRAGKLNDQSCNGCKLVSVKFW